MRQTTESYHYAYGSMGKLQPRMRQTTESHHYTYGSMREIATAFAA